MPGFDKTGPEGKGPMTGRRMGLCNPKAPKGQKPGRFFGRGIGRGFGRRFGWNTQLPADEK